jgi:hypothetical protein
MWRLTVFIVAFLCLVSLSLQAQEDAPVAAENAITHGEFAVLLLKATLGSLLDTEPEPEDALTRVQILGLVPATWSASGSLTHGELADVLDRLGIVYLPTTPNAPASRPFVEAFLRRELGKLRDYMATRLGLGFSVTHVRDQGIDRAVSPSQFE